MMFYLAWKFRKYLAPSFLENQGRLTLLRPLSLSPGV
jgi:hypothetical protein